MDYKKPWFKRDFRGEEQYVGQFTPKGYTNDVRMTYTPLLELIKQITDEKLRSKFMLLIEEMKDACEVCSNKNTHWEDDW